MGSSPNQASSGAGAAVMMGLDSRDQRSQDSATAALRSEWPINLKLTQVDLSTETFLIHFQGHYLTTSDLDYSILQVEIQNTPKTKGSVEVGEFCLVEDLISGLWHRGQIRTENADTFDVFLIDHGNVLSVAISQMSSCSNEFFDLPPKIVSGFFSNVLPKHDCWDSFMGKYLLSLIGKNVTGYIHALLPHKILIFEAPDLNQELVGLGFGKHVDTDTFLLLVQMLTEMPLEENLVPCLNQFQKPRGRNTFQNPCIKGPQDMQSIYGTPLCAGTFSQLKITAAVNPGLFYCQTCSAASDLQTMSEKLTAACSSMSSNPNQTPQDNLGLLCSVRGKDGKWYRGFVQCLPVNSLVKVLFVDYGFCESVRVENILRLPPSCLSLPIMAFPCALPATDQKDRKQRQLFLLKKGILSGELHAKILSLDVKLNIYSIEIISNKDCIVRGPKLPQEVSHCDHEAVPKCAQGLPQGGDIGWETVMAHISCLSVLAEGITAGCKCEGYVVHVNNPNDFWLRTEKRNSDFEDLMTQMSEHFSQIKLDEQVLECPQVGTMCCAMYEYDMLFYRAVVKQKLDYGAVVLFIDFGNSEKVPYSLIKKIPERFASQAAFSLGCTLGHIMPIIDVWTSASNQFFRQAVLNKSLRVHVMQQRKDKLVVDLFTMESTTFQNISELLISSKQAESLQYTQSDSVTEVRIKTKKSRHCKAEEEFSSSTQHQEVLPRDEKALVSQIKGQPACTDTGNETPKCQEPVVIKNLQLMLGCQMPVRCTRINYPSDFWCQLSDLSALEELMAKIQQYYSTHTVPVPVGAVFCIAMSPEDGKWYRALISKRTNSNKVIVLLVDNGASLQVEEHKLQQILPEYCNLETQAFRCSIYNLVEPISPNNCGKWSTKGCTLFRDFVLKHSVSLTCSLTSLLWVTDIGLCRVVDLHSSQSVYSITELLIRQGLARPVKIQSMLTSSALPASFSYSSFNLSCGKEEKVFITHVSNAWEIYCHLDRNREIIEELETKISEEKEMMHGADLKAPVDGMCLAKYVDGRWYRGLAKPVQSSLHLAVFYVDYGNACIVEKTNVSSIPRHSAELLYTPMQAVKCSLACVPKAEPMVRVRQWLEETLLNEPVRAVVVGKHEDGSVITELFDGDVSINSKVIEHIDNLTQTEGNLPPVSNKPTGAIESRHFISHEEDTTASPTINTTRCQQQDKRVLATVHATQSQKHDKRVSPTLNTTHSQQHDKRVSATINTTHSQQHDKRVSATVNTTHNQQHDKRVSATVNTTQRQRQDRTASPNSTKGHRFAEMPQLFGLPDKRLKPGLKVLCYASHVNTVSDFFLQLREDETEIQNMREVLNSSVSQASLIKQELTSTETEISNIVVAEYEDDGALYRAVVIGSEGNRFNVEFLDYGNLSVVSKDQIYYLPGKLLFQPRLCIPCSLLNTSAYDKDSTFWDAITDKPLMVEFVSWIGTQWKVKIEILDPIESFSVEVPDGVAEPPSEFTNQGEKYVPSSTATQASPTNEGRKPQEVTVSTSDKTLVPQLSVGQTKSKMCLHEPDRKPDHTNASLKSWRTSESTDMTKDILNAVKPSSQVQGVLLSVLQNGSFYVRLDKRGTLLLKIESLIAKHLNGCHTMPIEHVKRGLKCLVKGPKDSWSRAIVVHIDELKCLTFLVDHGLTTESTCASLRQVHSDLAHIPGLAVLCKLNNPSLGVTQLAQESLRRLVGDELKLCFLTRSDTENIWLVDIALIQQAKMTNSGQPIEDFQLISRGTEIVKMTTNFKDDEASHKFYFAPISVGQVYYGFAAAVTSPFDFYIVLEDSLLIMNEVSAILKELPSEIPSLPEAHLVPGSCCLVYSNTEGRWCRAEIVSAATTILINLVDYGHRMNLAYSSSQQVKILPEALKALPKVAYPCSLRGVNPVSHSRQWTDEAAVFFQDNLCYKNIQIVFWEFVSGNQGWDVDVLNNSTYLSQELMKAGHSSYADLLLELRFQEEHLGNVFPLMASSTEDSWQELLTDLLMER